MGRLTTHVLDTANGRPAAGVTIELRRFDGEQAIPIKQVTTNSDGRTNAPLLADEEFAAATYELVFDVGSYFTQAEGAAGSPPFLDRVPVRFTVSDARAHYHVPLLVSPWAYSTYRGS
jgi:5-hydroxyisourate hydrolase